uniref:Uncharacterized protein n=1 Tax=Anguilla anguilla TaxID=7936 RepID=A0A0E9PJS2_ANGAN
MEQIHYKIAVNFQSVTQIVQIYIHLVRTTDQNCTNYLKTENSGPKPGIWKP